MPSSAPRHEQSQGGDHGHAHSHGHAHGHGHSHGLVDDSIKRSRAGVRAVSLALERVAGLAVVALGLDVADPLIGLAISLLILRITWRSWRTVRGC